MPLDTRTTQEPVVTAMTRWVEALDHTDLSPEGGERLHDAIIDGFGCALHGSALPWSLAARSAGLDTGDGGVTIWGAGSTAGAMTAAFANGVAIRAFELDDFNDKAAGVHATSAILPAVAAIAELGHTSVSGPRLVTAAAVGWEVAVRVGECLGRDFPMRGWHASAIFATIGGAAAAARALDLRGSTLQHALSLGTLFASGLVVARAGGMAKRIYAGQAAANALHAALLARAGVTGPLHVYEHPNGGFCPTFAPGGDFDLRPLMEERTPSAVEGIVLKLHAACGSAHPALDGVRALMEAEPEITPQQIESIRVGMSAANVRYLGQPYAPSDATVAQFSVPFCIAAMVLEGEVTPRQFRDELLDAPAIRDLAAAVVVELDPDIDGGSVDRRNAARIEVTLRSGKRFEVLREGAHGGSRDPLRVEEVDAKFRSLAGATLAPEDVDRQLGLLRALDDLDDIQPLVQGFGGIAR